jgi:hypothetical protein
LKQLTPDELETHVDSLCASGNVRHLKDIADIFPNYLNYRHLARTFENFNGQSANQMIATLEFFKDIGFIYRDEKQAFRIGILHIDILKWCLNTYHRHPDYWLSNLVAKNFGNHHTMSFRILSWLHTDYDIIPRVPCGSGRFCHCVSTINEEFAKILQTNNSHIIQRRRLIEILQAMAPLLLPAYVLLWLIEWCVDGPMPEIDRIRMIERYYDSYRRIRIKK